MKLFFAMFVAVFFAACASKQEVGFDEIQRHMVLEGFDKKSVESLKTRRNINDLLEFEVILKAPMDGDVLYKVDWLDKDGFTLSDPLSKEWRRIHLNAGKEFVFGKIAPNKNAVDFKIHLQRR